MFASKAPKSRFYGGSASYDHRLAFSINKKNEGEKFASKLSAKLSLSAGSHTKKFYDTLDNRDMIRLKKSLTKEFKKRRLFLKNRKSKLRQKKESIEGPETYQSDIDLLKADFPPMHNVVDDSCDKKIVFFDLETGGFSKDSDILQIAAKCNKKTFSIYVTPTKSINEQANEVTGLRVVAGKLQCHGEVVLSVTLSESLQEFYKFLCELNEKCVLVAHNCNFDRPRLLAAIKKTYLLNHFQNIVYGFTDTLPLIKQVKGSSKKGDNKLENLATFCNIPTLNAHNAINDVIMLEQVIMKLGISLQKTIESILTWDKAIELENYKSELPSNLKKIEELKLCTSLATRKKIVSAKISYQLILDTFKDNKLAGLVNLFGENENGVIAVTKNRSVIKKFLNIYKKLLKIKFIYIFIKV